MNQQLPKTLPSFIWHFLKPYQSIAAIFILLAIMAGFWGTFNSIILKHIINLLPKASTDISLLFWPAAAVVLNFVIFDNFTWRSIGFINYKYQAVIKNKIISETTNYVLGNDYQFFQDNLSGRISSQIITLADNIEVILHRHIVNFIRGASLLVASFTAAYFVNVKFFYTFLLWFIAFATFSILMSKRLVNLADNQAKTESFASGQLVDSVANHSNVRIFSNKDYEIARMRPILLASQKAFQEKELFLVILNCIQGTLITILMGFCAFFLVYLYGKGMVSMGDFALILVLAMELGHMMWFTMSQVDDFNQAIGKSKQSLSALMIQSEVKDKSDAEDLRVTKGEIVFDDVQFHYKNAEPLFQKKSVIIKEGEKVGLVGYSGGGKSTFVNLILRLYDVSVGKILIDSHDIRDITQNSLRNSIAMIPQDPSLFHRSLMDNIRYSKPDASEEEVIAAAKKAHAHEFISKLSEGYHSLVGERGVKLSGGQRQRIAIARAFLKNAPILILDEATSQLDSVTEKHIQDSLWQLMQNKTTIVIAHRLSTLLHMDRILVFEKGKIVEDGTHKALLEKGGVYSTLWKAQVGGFLLDDEEAN